MRLTTILLIISGCIYNDSLVLGYGNLHRLFNFPLNLKYQLPDNKHSKINTWLTTYCSLKLKSKILNDQIDIPQKSIKSNRKNVDKWNIMYNYTVEYGEKHGNFSIPPSYILPLPNDTEIKLGSWFVNQFKLYRKGKLLPDRAKLFKILVDQGKLHFEVEKLTNGGIPKDDKWDTIYIFLLEYGDKHDGKCNVPNSYTLNLIDGTKLKLGKWLTIQRNQYAAGTLRQDRKDRLQELVDQNKLKWDIKEAKVLPDDAKWNIIYNYFLKYGQENNENYNVPDSYIFLSPDKTEVKLGKWLSKQRKHHKLGTLSQDRSDRLQVFVDQGKLIWDTKKVKKDRQVDIKWKKIYNAFLEYGEKQNGNFNVPIGCIFTSSDNSTFELGKWLSTQRRQFKSGTLPKDRLKLLQELVDQKKLYWNAMENKGTYPDEIKWDIMYNYVVVFGQENRGDCNVPTYYNFTLPNKKVINLGVWLRNQRGLFNKHRLAPNRLKKLQVLVDQNKLRLEPLNQITTRRRSVYYDKKWNMMYNLLVEYGKSHNNDYNVPKRYVFTFPDTNITIKLGNWLIAQRTLKNSKSLSQERTDRLQKLVDTTNLLWNATEYKNNYPLDDAMWNMKYNYLLEYGEENNGNCNVPQNYFRTLSNGTKIYLGTWLTTQHVLYNSKTLPQNRFEPLQLLVDQKKLLWDPPEEKLWKHNYKDDFIWNSYYHYLLDYGEKNKGNCNVPHNYIFTSEDKSEVKLGRWLAKQRRQFKAGTLAKERTDRLLQLVEEGKLQWEIRGTYLGTQPNNEHWNIMYNYLIEYGEENGGNCNVPQKYSFTLSNKEKINLGEWLLKQRKLHRTGRLLPYRLEKLQILVDQNKLNPFVTTANKREKEEPLHTS